MEGKIYNTKGGCMRYEYKFLGGKHRVWRPPRKSRRRIQNYIKIYLNGMCVDSIEVDQDAIRKETMNNHVL